MNIPQFLTTALIACGLTSLATAQQIAYIYGDVAEDGTTPSGAAAAYDQMLLTDSGNTGLSQFKSMIEANGYTITQFYDQSTTLDATFLNQYDVIIFGLHQKIWNSGEKAALTTWLEAGGGMLIYSDSAAGGKYNVVGAQNTVGQTAVNNLISSYGMQVTVDQANGIKAFRAGPSATHPIVTGQLILEGEGVSPIAVDPTGPASVLIPYVDHVDYKVSGNPDIPHQQNISITNPNFAAIALCPVTEGTIVAMFDRQPMWNNGPGSDIERRDNEALLLRIIQFLTGDLGLPFSEDFETHGDGQPVDTTNGWQQSGSGSANTQSETVYTGSSSLQLTDQIAVSHGISSSENVVWCDLQIRFAPTADGTNPALPESASAAVFLDASGKLNIADGNSWTIPNGIPSVSTTDWHRISLQLNYTAQTYSVWLNDVRVAEGLDFANSVAGFSGVEFAHNSSTSTYVDELSIITNEPSELDNDGDRLTNAWEIANGLNAEDDGSTNPDYGFYGNPDGDAFNNFQEFAFDLNPYSIDNAQAPYSTLSTEGEINYFGIVYRENLQSTQINYTVQFHNDLVTGPWNELSGQRIVVDPDPDGDGSSQLIEIRTPRDTDKKFLRLSVAPTL